MATDTIASHLADADSVQENLEMDNKEDESSTQNAAIQDEKVELVGLLIALDGPERRKQDQSATVVQASFRGYLARRAYLALKGIINLQALIRGHLVRRQAVSTIHCLLGIVKLQALVRGKRESKLVNSGEGKHGLAKNLSANVFGRKFLVLSPKKLYFQYDSADPNSVISWLDRWSVSNFWKPTPGKLNGSAPMNHNQTTQGVKTEPNMVKRNNKLPSARVDNGSTFEVERSRRTFRKPSIHSVEISDPEAAKSELEKVKRSLRKVHESTFPPAVEDVKPKQSPESIFPSSGQNVLEQTKSIAPEKTTVDPYDALPNLIDVKTLPEQHTENEPSDSLPDFHTNVDTKTFDNVTHNDKIVTENEHQFVKQDGVFEGENQKDGVKGSSQAKQESVQDGSNKQPKVPSYMLATKSAKAKLRDGSSLLKQEASEKSLPTRRHSLPSATKIKVISSPKAQTLTPTNGKPKNNSGKHLSVSKDGSGKVDWRR